MSTRELAVSIVNALSDEQIQAFITLFGSENAQAIIESDKIANDKTRTHYNSIEEIEKVIFENE